MAKSETPELAPLKLIVRYLSKSGNYAGDAFPSHDVETYIGSYIDLGYTLLNTHYMGENPEGVGVLFVLVK